MLLIMLRLWVQPLYGPITQDFNLMLFVGPLQLRFLQNHWIFLFSLVSEDFKIISGKFWCFKQENSISLPHFPFHVLDSSSFIFKRLFASMPLSSQFFHRRTIMTNGRVLRRLWWGGIFHSHWFILLALGGGKIKIWDVWLTSLS